MPVAALTYFEICSPYPPPPPPRLLYRSHRWCWSVRTFSSTSRLRSCTVRTAKRHRAPAGLDAVRHHASYADLLSLFYFDTFCGCVLLFYIREARKRKMVGNAFARLDEYRNRESVSVLEAKKQNETNRRKTRVKSTDK